GGTQDHGDQADRSDSPDRSALNPGVHGSASSANESGRRASGSPPGLAMATSSSATSKPTRDPGPLPSGRWPAGRPRTPVGRAVAGSTSIAREPPTPPSKATSLRPSAVSAAEVAPGTSVRG